MNLRTTTMVFFAALLLVSSIATAQTFLDDFDTDTSASWADNGSFISHSHDGSSIVGLPGSGSLSVLNAATSSASGSVNQCIAGISDATTYDFGAWIRVPTGQGVTGFASAQLWWYDGSGCTGTQTVGPDTALAPESGSWELMTTNSGSPPVGTVSAYIVLRNSKSSAGDFEAFFDGVRLCDPLDLVTGCNTVPVEVLSFSVE
jgi:hypothetical protein